MLAYLKKLIPNKHQFVDIARRAGKTFVQAAAAAFVVPAANVFSASAWESAAFAAGAAGISAVWNTLGALLRNRKDAKPTQAAVPNAGPLPDIPVDLKALSESLGVAAS